MAKEYIGDSIYASWDGINVVLTTENGIPGDPSNKIYIEQAAATSLQHYMHQCFTGRMAPDIDAPDIEMIQLDMENNL